jgi:hypothetical protein
LSFLSGAQRLLTEAGAEHGAPKFLERHTSEEHSGYSPEYGFSAGSIEWGRARQYYWSDAPASAQWSTAPTATWTAQWTEWLAWARMPSSSVA